MAAVAVAAFFAVTLITLAHVISNSASGCSIAAPEPSLPPSLSSLGGFDQTFDATNAGALVEVAENAAAVVSPDLDGATALDPVNIAAAIARAAGRRGGALHLAGNRWYATGRAGVLLRRVRGAGVLRIGARHLPNRPHRAGHLSRGQRRRSGSAARYLDATTRVPRVRHSPPNGATSNRVRLSPRASKTRSAHILNPPNGKAFRLVQRGTEVARALA